MLHYHIFSSVVREIFFYKTSFHSTSILQLFSSWKLNKTKYLIKYQDLFTNHQNNRQ